MTIYYSQINAHLRSCSKASKLVKKGIFPETGFRLLVLKTGETQLVTDSSALGDSHLEAALETMELPAGTER